MIKNIFVNNIGSLRDFANNESPFPNGNIIIHGMNGSGKSQLSSVLQKVSKLRAANQLGQSHIEITNNEVTEYLIKRKSREVANNVNIEARIDGFNLNIDVASHKISYNDKFPKLFVFNEEYIQENVGDTVNLPDKTIRIGERNQDRDDLQNEIRANEVALKKIRKNIEDLVQKTKNESGFSNQTRTSRIISVENYLALENPGEENVDAKKQLDKLSNPPDPINFHLSIHKPNLDISETEQSEIETIFKSTYIEPKLTQEFYSSFLKTNKLFYEEGVNLFKKEKKKCPFCLSPKDEDDSNIKELIKYIDSTYNEKLEIVRKYHSDLKKYQKRLDNFLTQWNSHINNINEKAKLLAINHKIEDLKFPNEVFEKYLNVIQSKLENMSLTNEDLKLKESIQLNIENCLDIFNNDHEEHIKFIKEINTAIDKVSGKKRALGEKIIKHHMYELWCCKLPRQ